MACEKCGCSGTYAANDKCTVCAQFEAHGFYAYANGRTNPDGTVNAGTLFPRMRVPDEWGELLARRFTDPSLRIVSTPCKQRGHVGLVRANGSCVQCAEPNPEVARIDLRLRELRDEMAGLMRRRIELVGSDMSPRQRAIEAGEKWYLPDEPCGKCGQLAERYVANGKCRGCAGR